MTTKLRAYRVSDEVDAGIKKLGKEYGGIDRGLRSVLFAEPHAKGNFVKLGRYKCVVENWRDLNFYGVLMLENGLRVVAHGTDLKPFKPTEVELMAWKLEGRI